ncbi:DUF4435 domain-containing protein [Pectobacterium brasiliense]|uniref:DUF4435 domain-containing protein n=1 Tax=Pectobacterium brasiliense TaxID=180957 RepID=UPI00196907B9|nr:DUF4435 domain-containing protein [Pectobacterium brasiliense]MBN3255186.1 DUF4435 domain-containing protein [Pectobacterium brasiliense]
MSDLSYTVESYLAAIAISTKKRVLVEGRYDRQHLNNLLSVIAPKNRIHIDAAQYIKSNDRRLSKNNRLKVEAVHEGAMARGITSVSFLCDREFRAFSINESINDELNGHYMQDRLHWTYGHSMENYFFNKEILVDAYKYLFAGEEKNTVFELFESALESAFILLAAVTLASKEMNRLTFPLSVLNWKDFIVNEEGVSLKLLDALTWEVNDDNKRFYESFIQYLSITKSSTPVICARISRGHTAMVILQRIFSSCIYHASFKINPELAEEGANKFSNISEELLANSLSESWVRKVDRSQMNYPVSLFDDMIS